MLLGDLDVSADFRRDAALVLCLSLLLPALTIPRSPRRLKNTIQNIGVCVFK